MENHHVFKFGKASFFLWAMAFSMANCSYFTTSLNRWTFPRNIPKNRWLKLHSLAENSPSKKASNNCCLWKIHRKIRFYVVCHTLFGHIFPIKSPLSMLKSPMFTGQLPFSFSTRSSTVWSWLFVTTMVRTGEPRLEKHPIHCQFSSTSIYSTIFHYIPLYSTIFHYVPLYFIIFH